MNPKIIYEEPMLLIGMSFYGDPFSSASLWSEENEIGWLWKRFMNFIKSNPDKIKNIMEVDKFFEVHIQTEETLENGNREVFIGVQVDDIDEVPLECVVKKLPKTEYAVFNIKGNKIVSDWPKEIYMEWIPKSSYQAHYEYNIQVYDGRFKGMDRIDESEIEVYVPIKRASSS